MVSSTRKREREASRQISEHSPLSLLPLMVVTALVIELMVSIVVMVIMAVVIRINHEDLR